MEETNCSNGGSMITYRRMGNLQSTVFQSRSRELTFSLRKLRETLLQQRERLEEKIAVIRVQAEDAGQQKKQSPRV
jgi:hypothetical protein